MTKELQLKGCVISQNCYICHKYLKEDGSIRYTKYLTVVWIVRLHFALLIEVRAEPKECHATWNIKPALIQILVASVLLSIMMPS